VSPGTTNITYTVDYGCGSPASSSKTHTVNSVGCGQNNEKYIVCHSGNEICISESAVAAHLAHGDVLGNCPTTQSRGLNEIETQDMLIQVYPNPNKGNFTVTMDLPGNYTDKTIRVINMSGQIVKELHTRQNQLGMNINKQGIYLVQIISNKQILRKRLIIVTH
jgi:hypothetical protein